MMCLNVLCDIIIHERLLQAYKSSSPLLKE